MAGTQRRATDDEADKAFFVTALGVGLVFLAAAALVVAMFLKFAQPVGVVPIVLNDNLYAKLGWLGFIVPVLLAFFGYQAGQGKEGARWSLLVICVAAAVGIFLLGLAKSWRTLYPVGLDGAVDASQPGFVAGLGIAIYVAGAAVAVAFVGALALLQSAAKAESLTRAEQVQRRIDAQAKAKPEDSAEPEAAALEADASGTEVESHAVEAPRRTIGSRLESTWPMVAAIVVVAVTAGGYYAWGRPHPPALHQPVKLTPEQVAMEKFLLDADQINTAMGTNGLTVRGTVGEMVDIGSAISDDSCLPMATPAGAKVYDGSGWNAVVGRDVREAGNFFQHGVDQFVVSFPSAEQAGAFFTASTQSWQACANRDFTMTTMGQNLVQTVGPVSNADGTLSASHTQPHFNGAFACQRALTVAKNFVIDVSACSLNMPSLSSETPSASPTDTPTDTQSVTPSDTPTDTPSDTPSAAPASPPPGAAVSIAHQIAARVA